MYTDITLKPIYDTAQYVAADGTQYPGNYPKDAIAGLHKVTEVPAPTDAVTTGFIIDNTYAQVWQSRPYTADEIAAMLVSEAKRLLDKSDTTMLRVQEAISLGLTTPTTADVVAWVEYRKALRAIISTKTGTLPTQPPYPANT